MSNFRANDTDLDRLAAYATPLISDNLDRLQGAVGLRPFHQAPQLAGRAFTVKTRLGDNLFVHLALDLAAPGDVIVVDAGGDGNNAIVGEIMKSYAQSRGIAGFVIDGAVRDVASFAQGPFQCFARSVSHRGPYKSGPGMVRCPVSIGGMVVHHGDYIIGDADGVVAVRPSEVPALLEKVERSFRSEEALMEDIRQGRFDRTWLKSLIAQHAQSPAAGPSGAGA